MIVSGVFYLFGNIMPYQLTDTHTNADVGLVAYGTNLEELFADSAYGLTSIMVESDDIQLRRELSLELKADDLPELYFDWLSEIIYIKDAESFLLKRVEFDIIDKTAVFLRARLFGDSIAPNRQVLKIDVKAVTKYKFRMEKVGERWNGEVVFDL